MWVYIYYKHDEYEVEELKYLLFPLFAWSLFIVVPSVILGSVKGSAAVGAGVGIALFLLILYLMWKLKVWRLSKTDKMLLTKEAKEMLARKQKST